MGMCERRSIVDDISSRRVREREHPIFILHSGFCQFEHGIHRVRAGGPRVPGLFWIVINVVRTRVSELFWQVYMLFITWRYSSRLVKYSSLQYGTD